MKDEKQYTEGISVKDNKFLAWLDNYWYHYKWTTIIVAFAVVVFSVCIIQACSNKKSDILITYAGSAYLTTDEKISIKNTLGKFLPDEIVPNKEVDLDVYYVLTKEQIEQIQKQTDSEGYQKYVDTSFNSQELDNFESQLMTGSGSIIFIDKDLYKMFFGSSGETERLQPLSEIYEKTPEGAIDAYGIRLGDTALYQNNIDLKSLPEDTVICLHKKVFNQKDYDKQIEAFKAVVESANNGEN